MLNNYFPHIFVINLERRDDRKLGFISQASRIGLNSSAYTFVPAVDGLDIEFNNPLNIPHFHAGDIGCTLSHLKVVQMAKNMDLPFYLVLEDDVLFRPEFAQVFENYWYSIPADWNLVYFGANHNNSNPPKVSDHAVRVNGSYTTHAMAVHSIMYDDLIRVWSTPNKQVDVLLSELHPKYNCYCFMPNLAGQRAGHSDILNRDVNYDFLLS